MQKVKSRTTGTRCHGEMQSRVELFSAEVWFCCATNFNPQRLFHAFSPLFTRLVAVARIAVLFLDTRESSPPSPVTSTWWLHP